MDIWSEVGEPQSVGISTKSSDLSFHKEEERPGPKKLFNRHGVGEELCCLFCCKVV